MPLITIAIPAYKKKYLSEAIESVLSQTFSNWELVIVNDCSPEDLDEIIERYDDTRIRYFKNSVNLGKQSIVLNWNRCLEYARGDYFVLLCDDDLMDAFFLEKMLRSAIAYNANIVRCQTKYFSSLENKFFGNTEKWPEREDFNSYIKEKLKGHRKHTISEFLIKTTILCDFGGYKSFPVGYYSDDATILRIASLDGMVSCNEMLITFRKSNENITTNCIYNLGKCQAAMQFYKWLKDSFSDKLPDGYNVQQKLEYDLYEYFISSKSLKMAFSIVHLVPSTIWPMKTKIINFFVWIKKRLNF